MKKRCICIFFLSIAVALCFAKKAPTRYEHPYISIDGKHDLDLYATDADIQKSIHANYEKTEEPFPNEDKQPYLDKTSYSYTDYALTIVTQDNHATLMQFSSARVMLKYGSTSFSPIGKSWQEIVHVLGPRFSDTKRDMSLLEYHYENPDNFADSFFLELHFNAQGECQLVMYYRESEMI